MGNPVLRPADLTGRTWPPFGEDSRPVAEEMARSGRFAVLLPDASPTSGERELPRVTGRLEVRWAEGGALTARVDTISGMAPTRMRGVVQQEDTGAVLRGEVSNRTGAGYRYALWPFVVVFAGFGVLAMTGGDFGVGILTLLVATGLWGLSRVVTRTPYDVVAEDLLDLANGLWLSRAPKAPPAEQDVDEEELEVVRAAVRALRDAGPSAQAWVEQEYDSTTAAEVAELLEVGLRTGLYEPELFELARDVLDGVGRAE